MAIGDIKSISIDPEGWSAAITVEGLGVGGVYDLGIGVDNKPDTSKIVVTAARAGFDDAGNATTISQTIYGTGYRRKKYPDSIRGVPVPDEAVDGIDVVIKIALSDYLYTTDVVSMTLAAGVYTQGGTASAPATVACTNLSEESPAKTVGNWTIADRDIVQDGFALRCVAFHRSAREGRPVRGVAFSVTDQHAHTVTQIATTPVKSLCSKTGQYIIEYVVTVDTSTLTDGDTLSCNFRAFPWYGNEASCLNTNDGEFAYPNRGYCKREFKLDKTHTAYGRAVAVVDPAGAGASPAVVNYTAFNPATPPDSYGSIFAAINAIVAFNNANFGRSNCSGGIIYLRSGNHAWTGGTNTPGTTEFMLTIEAFPGVSRDNVQITSISGDNDAGQHTKFKNLYINTAGAIFTDELFAIYDNCRLNHTGAAFAYTNNSYNFVIDCEVDGGHSTLGQYSTNTLTFMLIRGSNIADGFDGSVHGVCLVGNKFLGFLGGISNNYTGSVTIDNAIAAYNYMCHKAGSSPALQLMSSANTIPYLHGAAIIQNVFERATGGAANSSPLGAFAADSTTQTICNNILIWQNSFIGQRVNFAYNDYSLNNIGPAWRKQWSVQNNIFHDWNIVTDIDLHGGSPDDDRYGNHSLVHGSGISGCICSDEAGTTSYNPQFPGVYSVTPSPGNIDLGFIHDGSSGVNGDTLGNGDYHLTNSSDAAGIAHYWLLPFDLEGLPRTADNDPGPYASLVANISGNVQSQPATASGAVSVEVGASGNIQSQAASASGTASTEVAVSSNSQSQPATGSGSVAVEITVSGNVQSQPATASGTAVVEPDYSDILLSIYSPIVTYTNLNRSHQYIYIGAPLKISVRVDIDLDKVLTVAIRYRNPDQVIGFLTATILQTNPGIIAVTLPSVLNNRAGEWEFRSWVTVPYDPGVIPGKPCNVVIRNIDEV